MTQPLRIYKSHESGRFTTPVTTTQVNTAASRKRAVLVAVASLITTAALFAADASLVAIAQSWSLGTLPEALIDAAAPFATAAGVGLIAVSVAAASPKLSRSCTILVVCVCTAGITATCLRTVILRTKPAAVKHASAVGEAPRLNVKASFSPDGHCFPAPAGAVAMAAGLAFSRLFPRGRVIFLAIATLSVVRLLVSGQHYPSDMTAGATVGCFAYLLWYESKFANERVVPWASEGSIRETPQPRPSSRRAA